MEVSKAVRKLDKSDLTILKALQEDGRITKVDLAKKVNLSASPCWERLRRLEREGYVDCYRAIVNLRKVAAVTEVIIEVTLENHHSADFHRFESAMQEVPEVVECWAVGGGMDYILKVVVSDVEAYQKLLDRLLEAGIGIDKYFGYIVTKSVKSSPPSIDCLLKPE